MLPIFEHTAVFGAPDGGSTYSTWGQAFLPGPEISLLLLSSQKASLCGSVNRSKRPTAEKARAEQTSASRMSTGG